MDLRLATVFAVLTTASAWAGDLVSVSGQVILKNENLLILKDSNSAYRVQFDSSLAESCQEGDLVTIRGKARYHDWLDENRLAASNITVVGRAPLPETITAEGAQIQDGHLLNEFVRLNGTISAVSPGSTGWSWVRLKTQTGDVGLTIRESNYPRKFLETLIDAEVSVRGIVVRSWGSTQQLAPHVSLRGENALHITRAAPTDPFAAPAFERIAGIHRQRISGTVLASGGNRGLLLTEAEGPVQILTQPGTVWPAVGHRATAVGFPGTDPVRLWFTGSLIRDDGQAGPLPQETPQTDLNRIFKGWEHGRTVQIEGTVRGSDAAGDRRAARLFLDTEDGRPVAVDLSAEFAGAQLPVRGSVVRVTGCCIVEYEDAAPVAIFPRFRGITMLPRTRDDLVMLKGPPWLTPFRAGLIAFLLVGVFGLREALVRSAARLRLKERTSLAIELHDSLAQFLTGISFQLDAAELAEGAGRTAEAGRHILCARRALKSCRENLRYCLGDLRRTSSSDLRLGEAIRQAVLPHIGAAKLVLRFNVARSHLSDTATHAVVSIVRELAVNAVRHGQASQIRVAGRLKDGRVRFSVCDNGRGFEPAAAPGPGDGHYGLQGVRERIKDFHGSLQLHSRPGKGTKATVTLTP